MPLWDLNPNGKNDKHDRVEAPSAIEACRRAMPGRTFWREERTRGGGWLVYEADNVTVAHEVYERSG